MHFDMLPKDTRNKDAIREYEQGENKRVRRWLARVLAVLVPLAVAAWLLLRH